MVFHRRYLLVPLLFLLLFCTSRETPHVSDPFPHRPSNFQAEVLGPHRIGLSWDNPDDSRFYAVKVVRSTQKHPDNIKEGELIYSGNGENFVDENLTPGIRYYYSAFSSNREGNLSPRISVNAMPFDLTLARNIQIENLLETIQLTWEKPIDIYYQGIQIQRSSLKYPEFPSEGRTVYRGEETSFTDSNVTELVCGKDKTYYYSFFSYNQNGEFSTSYARGEGFAWCPGDVPVNVKVISPESGQIFNGNLNLEIEATTLDAGGIAGVRFYVHNIDGTPEGHFSHSGGNRYVYQWNAASLSDGQHTVWVEAVNSMGVKESAELKLILDTAPPEIQILAPNDGGTYQGSLRILAEAGDETGMEKVSLHIGDHRKVDLSPPYEFIWDTTAIDAEGQNEIRLTAEDRAGNTASKSILITVNNPPRVVQTGPERDAVGISYTTDISVVFSEKMNEAGISSSTFYLTEKSTGEKIPGTAVYNTNSRTAVWRGDISLEPQTVYVATVSNRVKDSTGLSMVYDYSWEFTTGSSTNIYDDPGALFDVSTFAE